MKQIEFIDVSKNLSGRLILNSLNFAVSRGEFFSLLGPNGAGKSTVMNLTLGLRRPDSGKIQVFGMNPREKKVKLKMTCTPQDLSFPLLLTVLETLSLVASHYAEKKSIEELIELLDLKEILYRKTGGLSGGEKRRLGLACALIGNPEILILDEPTTGMDIESRQRLWGILKTLSAQKTTILLTTHYLEEVEELSSRVLMLDHGKTLFDGSVQQIKSKVSYRKVILKIVDLAVPRAKTLEHFQKLAGTHRVEDRDTLWTIWTLNSDLWLEEFFQDPLPFKDLIVEESSLEEAFLEFQKNAYR